MATWLMGRRPLPFSAFVVAAVALYLKKVDTLAPQLEALSSESATMPAR